MMTAYANCLVSRKPLKHSGDMKSPFFLQMFKFSDSQFCLLLHYASTTFVKEYELNILVTRYYE